MSTREPVNRAASRTLCPSVPIARESWKTGTITSAVPVSSSMRTSRTRAGASAFGDYYCLWCMERVAVIYSLDKIDGKDWYQWGSELILQSQRSNGSWQEMHGDVPDTCFAILFLTRANLAPDLTESLRILIPVLKK